MIFKNKFSTDESMRVSTSLLRLKETFERSLVTARKLACHINARPWVFYNRLSQFLDQHIEINEKSILQIEKLLISIPDRYKDDDIDDTDPQVHEDIDNMLDSLSELQKDAINMNWLDFFVLNMLTLFHT